MKHKPSKDELEKIKINKEFKMYPSKFQFLDNQNCWRPGDIHTLIGQTHSGKTSLVRSIVLEASIHIKVLVILSEETTKDIWYELDRSFQLSQEGNLENITLVSEQDEENLDLFSSPKEVVTYIRKHIIENDCKFVIFDNITTSQFYDKLEDQTKFANELKRLAKSMNIPILIIAHTQKDFKGPGMIDTDNIRGKASLAMMAEHFYCFNHRLIFSTRTQKDEHRVVLQVTKHRGIDRDGYFFYMHYNEATRLYDYDNLINSQDARAFLLSEKRNVHEDNEEHAKIKENKEQKKRRTIKEQADRDAEILNNRDLLADVI